MTLEELNECYVGDLEKMTNEQLLAHFAPYLTATRPDLAMIQRAKDKQTASKSRGNNGSEDMDDMVKRIMGQFNLPINL